MLLTFDGCYDDHLENAVPVLDLLKLPATFFPASAGLTHELGDVSGQRRNTLLDLAQAGHTIGCHTQNHPVLTRLSTTEVRQEVLGSKLALEDALGQRVSAFCYPYGAYDARVREIAQDAGFDVAFTVDLGGVKFGDDPYSLKRVPVLGGTQLRRVRGLSIGPIPRLWLGPPVLEGARAHLGPKGVSAGA